MKLRLRRTIVAKLEEIQEKTGMNRKSIINLAIYHGTLSIDHGFFPTIKKECQETYKEPIQINIPNGLKNKLYKYLGMKKFENINMTQLIEAFINMEFLRLGEEQYLIKKLSSEQLDEPLNEQDERLKEQLEDLNIHIKINSFLKEKVDVLSEYLGISQNQLYMYFFYTGCWENERKISPRTVQDDPILLEYINSLGLDRVKAICLVNAVLHYKYNIISK